MHTITIIIGGSEASERRSGFAGFIDNIEWGNAPAWAAFVTAAVAASFAWLNWRRERRRDDRAYQALLQAQAAQCAAWIDHHLNPPRLYIRNTSELPIENINAWFWLKDKGQSIPVSEVTDQGRLPVARMVIAPGETYQKDLGAELLNEKSIFQVSLTFTDAQGIFWARHDGKIVPNPFPDADQPSWFQGVDGSTKPPNDPSSASAEWATGILSRIIFSRILR